MKSSVNHFNYERLYSYRFRDISEKSRADVWRVISKYLYVELNKPKCMLDVACGRGEFINSVPSEEKWGIDLVDSLSLFSEDSDVKFVLGDVFSADLPLEYFDAILISNFLEHIESQQQIAQLLNQAFRLLKTGGRIAIMGPNFRYCYKNYFDCADHTIPLSHISVAEHVYSAGFTIRSVYKKFLPYSFRTSFLPQTPFLVSLYLRIPLMWSILGKQMLVIAERQT